MRLLLPLLTLWACAPDGGGDSAFSNDDSGDDEHAEAFLAPDAPGTLALPRQQPFRVGWQGKARAEEPARQTAGLADPGAASAELSTWQPRRRRVRLRNFFGNF
mgnify:CR=1 FL=1